MVSRAILIGSIVAAVVGSCRVGFAAGEQLLLAPLSEASSTASTWNLDQQQIFDRDLSCRPMMISSTGAQVATLLLFELQNHTLFETTIALKS
jgi:hypothetical protein